MKLCSFLLAALPVVAMAQNSSKPLPDYPKDYFRNPLDIPIYMAGNFGECRPGHFHSGVDIKTLGEEGQPVRAAAEGYISRIKMEKGGFGHAIYVTHPNGYTTLYAHLSTFSKEIQAYVKKEQYARQRWDVDLQLAPTTFPLKKGQQIALSGNTGASTAPHLHFEIRNTKTEHPLNPQLFGLPIVDKKPTVLHEVVLYYGNVYNDVAVSCAMAKKDGVYKPVKTDEEYATVNKDTIATSDLPNGIGIVADDYMDGSDNSLTFLTAELYLDDTLQSKVTLDDIGYDESRYMHAYADYKMKTLKHKWVQCLFRLPNNRLGGVYSDLNNLKGRLFLKNTSTHKIDIVLTDDGGNVTKAQFYLNPRLESTIMVPSCEMFHVNTINKYEDPNVSFVLDERQLYDDVCFEHSSKPDAKTYSGRYDLGKPYLPLHHYFDLMMRPNRPIPFDLRSKVVMMYSDGKDDDGRAASAEDKGWYKAAVRNFGTYWLDVDTTAPVITPQQKNGANLAKASQLSFTVKDAATSVKTFSGWLDGKWICFEQHGSSFFYKFDEHCPKGKHELVFKATDENGNERSYRMSFTR